MSAQAQIFPGVYFDVVEAPIEDSLPRMDIAAFVGYASAGPINTPFAVEDAKRFREIFGQDIELAWDAEKNEIVKSLLGLSVEAFFRNGGRRCWIVRVADGALAQTANFALPGLVRCKDSRVEQAVAKARSPGSWAEQIHINTALHVVQLPLEKNPGLDEPYFTISSEAWSIALVANTGQLSLGDIISIRPYQSTTLYLMINALESTSFGVRASGSRAYLLDENSAVLNAEASPAVLDGDFALDFDALTDPEWFDTMSDRALFNINSFDALGLSQALFSDQSTEVSITSPAVLEMDELFSAQLLHFDIIAQDNSKSEWRLSQLGFTKEQSRFWGLLPSDDILFSQTEGRCQKQKIESTQDFLEEINTPRFPLASSFSQALESHEWVYLPIGMPAFEDSALAVRAEFSNDASIVHLNGREFNALELNGIANAGSALFIDERLAGVGSDLLRREGNFLAFLRESSIPLVGVHSLLTIAEATLVSVPDGVHRRWQDIAPEYKQPLSPPVLQSVQTTREQGEYLVEWSCVDDVTQYRLEWSEDPELSENSFKVITGSAFPRIGEPINLVPQPDNLCKVVLGNKCPRTLYFRVRAQNREVISVWSNNIAKQIPEADFFDCENSNAEYLALSLEIDSAIVVSPDVLPSGEGSDGYMLTPEFDYAAGDDSFAEGLVSIEIQRSSEFTFIDSEILFPSKSEELDVGGSLNIFVEEPLDANVYYRARVYNEGIRGDATIGPWSNTVTLAPSRISQAILQGISDFNDADILAIHRALLRLCYARGDLFGVLSLPRHYTVQDAQDHFSRLSPVESAASSNSFDGPVSNTNDTLTARVNPLTVGEKNVCSHGGLYYPWLSNLNESSGQGSIGFNVIPPDGAVSAKIASKSIESGPWIAPANSPIVDGLALDTTISKEQWAALIRSHINVIRDDSRGFLLLSADTLTDNIELKEINVRRLMSMLMRLALREGNRYVFEPNSAVFQERVQQYFESVFDTLYSRGAFAGKKASEAYRVVTDSSVNTSQSIEAGRFIVELQVAPSHALKFIRVRLIQSGPSQIQVQEVAV